MNNILKICVVLVGVLLVSPVLSADFQKGLDAYTNRDFATALKEWKPLAEQGTADAQTNLGLLYEKGHGVQQDYKAAVKWYTLAAEQGFSRAQTNLGLMYDEGYGVTQDNMAAVKWYTLASEQGVALAQYNLGLMYVQGKGVPQDYTNAHMWWSIAESLGEKRGRGDLVKVTGMMSSTQLETAKRLARECVEKNYRGCGEKTKVWWKFWQ